MRNVLIVLSLGLSLGVLAACSMPWEEKAELTVLKNLPEGVSINLVDVADRELKSTLANLGTKYEALAKNQSLSNFTDLTDEELKAELGTETFLDGLVPGSAKKIKGEIFYVLLEKQPYNQWKYDIYQKNESVHSFVSEYLTYDPLISVRVIENLYTVEYVQSTLEGKNMEQKQEIWQSGQGSLTTKYAIQNAIMPYESNGKLTFLAQKDGKWFVAYGKDLLPEVFDAITFGYSLEPAAYMPKAFNYRYYVFFASQGGKQKLVEVDFGEGEEVSIN